MQNFSDQLNQAILEKKSVLCVGLDPQLELLPPQLLKKYFTEGRDYYEAAGLAIWEFNYEMINAVAPYTVAIKLQSAFHEPFGAKGIVVLEKTIAYAKAKGLLVIMDAKRGDGGATAKAYADNYIGKIKINDQELESPLRSDAVTINPYIGSACLDPFIKNVKEYGSGIFIVTKTSFAPNSEVEQIVTTTGDTVWQEVAKLTSKWGEGTEGESGYRNVGVVMGATYPEDAKIMRTILPNTIFLIPGYGAQGGGADEAVASFNADGLGGIVHSARGITYAWQKQSEPENYAKLAGLEAMKARDELNEALQRRKLTK